MLAAAVGAALALIFGVPEHTGAVSLVTFIFAAVMGLFLARIPRVPVRVVGWALLAFTGRLPWRLGRFLRFAAGQGILVRSDDVFWFRYALLQEYCAELYPHRVADS